MKTAEEIYEAMLAVYTEKTGFAMEDGSELAVRLYAAAAELESLYAYCDWALCQCFPQTATGENLDAHGTMRSLTRREGGKAAGTLRFSLAEARADDLTIPAGTVCTTAGMVRFVTTASAVIAAGETTADAPAEAEHAGVSGNAAAGTVTLLTQAPAGVAACTNPAAFAGGVDEEADEAFRARILDTFRRLPNGANSAYYENRVLQHSGVGAAIVLPRYQGVGTVGIVVAGAAGPADAALLEEIRADLQAVREIAVDVTVFAPTTLPVDVTVRLTPVAGTETGAAAAAVRDALTGYFTGALLGKPLYRAALGSVIYGTGLVENYEIAAPTEDLAGSKTELPVLGTLQVTEDL